MLVQAASGLEKLMAGRKGEVLQDSMVAQISAYVYYNAQVISKLTENAAFKNKFKEVIFTQIDKDFGEYIDAQARVKPKSLHHVYEWNKVGVKSARLFKLNKLESRDLSFQISYNFLPSKSFAKSGSKRRHVFVNKASVMEAGMPLKIAPRFAERLVFDTHGYTVFMPKGASVTVKRPGGVSVKNSFKMTHMRFFTTNLVNVSIKKSGFQRMFNLALTNALRLPASIKRVSYSFSPNTIRTQADIKLTAAFGGAL
jgi:hypothetical protein